MYKKISYALTKIPNSNKTPKHLKCFFLQSKLHRVYNTKMLIIREIRILTIKDSAQPPRNQCPKLK